MTTKKYLSLERLVEYDELIKSEIASGDSSTLSSAKSYADGLASGKSDTGHTHDDRYYTESEIDNKLSAVNTSITNITDGTIVVKNAEHATTADSADNAISAEKAIQDASGNVIADTYETKADASAKLTEAKTYTDSSSTQVKNDLLGGTSDTYNTLKKIGDFIDDHQDAIDSLEDVVANKADKGHNHDDRYYTKAEFDAFELITVDEIDGICGATIQVASLNEVTF